MNKINLLKSKESYQAEHEVKGNIIHTFDDNEFNVPVSLTSNEIAKQEIASELLQQGFSEDAVCRILNISPDFLT